MTVAGASRNVLGYRHCVSVLDVSDLLFAPEKGVEDEFEKR
jgi:hypothetical protein